MSYAGRHLICCNLLGVKEKRKGGEEGRRGREENKSEGGDEERGWRTRWDEEGREKREGVEL